ncbi:MAG: SulP family inorganic anion transporter [Sandaracinaceae bacterium]
MSGGDGPREEDVSRSSIPPEQMAALGRSPRSYLRNLRYDVPSSVVVFLVALPLCLGIAVASDMPPLAGMITGIVGGTVVAWASGSQLAVSGPAAGLTVIVVQAKHELGTLADGTYDATVGYEGLLVAVCLAGVMQVLLGLARAGIFAYYFPSTVIKGMLAGIGVFLILKQIPHAVGFDEDYVGDLSFLQPDDRNTFTEIVAALAHPQMAAIVISVVALTILVVMGRVPAFRRLRWLPAPLVAVTVGVGINLLFGLFAPGYQLAGDHVVDLPTGGLAELQAELHFPDFSRIAEPTVWTVAATLAAVASLETLLCIEAIDKLDPYKRQTPTNRELGAQGIGNVLSGLVGGLPMTAVIVRGSANIQSGGRTRMSAFVHGLLLLAAVFALPEVINLIPLAALAAVLLHVGYKLASYRLFRGMFRQPMEQWLPFIVTVVAIIFTDLLKGVAIGMGVAVFYILLANLRTPYFIHHREAHDDPLGRPLIRLELSENVSFLNRASVRRVLAEMPDDSVVEIDGRTSQHIHPDVVELILEFRDTAPTRGITAILRDIPDAEVLIPTA